MTDCVGKAMRDKWTIALTAVDSGDLKDSFSEGVTVCIQIDYN